MSLRRLSILGAFVMGCFLFATPSHAQYCPDCPGVENPTDGFNGWESLEPTGYQPPTVDTCTARASAGQRCLECVEEFYSNGNPKGTYICGRVARSSGCTCNNSGTASCLTKGTCSYLYS